MEWINLSNERSVNVLLVAMINLCLKAIRIATSKDLYLLKIFATSRARYLTDVTRLKVASSLPTRAVYNTIYTALLPKTRDHLLVSTSPLLLFMFFILRAKDPLRTGNLTILKRIFLLSWDYDHRGRWRLMKASDQWDIKFMEDRGTGTTFEGYRSISFYWVGRSTISWISCTTTNWYEVSSWNSAWYYCLMSLLTLG